MKTIRTPRWSSGVDSKSQHLPQNWRTFHSFALHSDNPTLGTSCFTVCIYSHPSLDIFRRTSHNPFFICVFVTTYPIHNGERCHRVVWSSAQSPLASKKGPREESQHVSKDMDVGQNGRPRGPQMWMSSLVLTIHNFGVPNFDPYPYYIICKCM